jgi:hypothetical protein
MTQSQSDQITYRRRLLYLCFDQQGLLLRPWPGRPLLIKWDDVEFVQDSWLREGMFTRPPFVPPLIDPIRPLGVVGPIRPVEGIGPIRPVGKVYALALSVVVRDGRRLVLRQASGWTRLWLCFACGFKFMAEGSNKVAKEAVFNLDIRPRYLNVTLEQLKDFLRTKCRFDLIFTID